MTTPAEELMELRRLEELEKKAALAAPQEKTFMDKVADYTPDVVKNVGTAAYKGLAGIATAAGDALNGSYDYTDGVRAMYDLPVRELDTSMPLTRALESTGYHPKTQGERYVNNTVRGATGALLGPGSLASIPRALITGGASGLVSEAAGQLPGIKGTKSEGAARVAAALAGGFGSSLLMAPLKNSKDLAREMLEGVRTDDLTAAKSLMGQAKTAGIPVNLDQAMGKDTNVTNLINTLVGRKEGQKVVDQLRAQPEQVQKLVTRLTSLLPGQVREHADVANITQSAATEALKKARTARTNATEPLYAQSGTVPAKTLDAMIDQATNAAKQAPDTNKGQLFNEMTQMLKRAKERNTPTPSGLLDANGKPILSAAQPMDMQELNASMRSIMTNAKNVTLSSSAGDREAIGGLGKMVASFRQQLGAVSPKFKKANDTYESISVNRVDPLKKSVIGRVAGLTGEQADAEAVNKLLPILARGRNPNAASSDITKFARETADNPKVFQDAFKTHFSNAVATAEKQANGALSPGLAKEMETAILGNASQRAGMKDALEAIAVGQGKPKNALYPGFMAAMQIIGASAKRPGAMGPNGEALNQVAGKSHIASGLRMIGLAPGKPAASGLQGWLTADAYRTLADNLTTAEGVAKLQALARVPVMSTKAQAIVNTLLATKAVETPAEVTNVTPGGNDSKED